MYKVLVTDDEPDLSKLISQSFRAQIKSGELSFEFAENGLVALDKLLADTSINIVFTDINMPVMDGLTLLTKINEQNIFVKAVVISAYGDMVNVRSAMNKGAFDFITKPIEFTDLTTTLYKAINEINVLKQGLEAKKNLEGALIEKAEAQQQALINLKEKEKLILQQNEMLEKQVAERTVEVINQKELIEVKNKEIIDSIIYAKHIQEAMLPSPKLISEHLTDCFILYLPKDIVAGDFYWFEQIITDKTKENAADQILIAAADCTGHGVSGALMSMLGVSLLNQIVNEKGIISPSLILDNLHAAVISALKQQETNSNDGMDIALCNIDLKNKQLHFAGANRPLWIIRNNELISIAPDKIPIGGTQIEKINLYTNHAIPLEKDDSIYMSTDGYADQFGGEMGKKIMTKNFKTFLLSINKEKMENQKTLLRNYFEKWKAVNEQVDDVLVIGIKI
jgi:phosphoserine phosphatase RsbU/P